MTSKRSDAADQLLNYLAMGLEPLHAVALLLVEDEDIPPETVELASWTRPMEARADQAREQLASSTTDKHVEEYWNAKREEIDKLEQDLENKRAVFDLEEVSRILNDE